MSALSYSEKDFFLQQHEADRRWAIASILAVVVHAAIFLMVLYLPSFIDTKPILEEVVSVSLVSMPDAGGPAAPVAAPH